MRRGLLAALLVAAVGGFAFAAPVRASTDYGATMSNATPASFKFTHGNCSSATGNGDFSIVVGDKTSTDAIWTYPENLPDALDLSAYVAFYPDRIDRWEELDI